LKIREYLMPKLVMPEDDNLAFSLPSLGERNRPQGFAPGKKKKNWRASAEIFPTELPKEVENALKEAVKFAVDTHGTQSLPELEVEEKIAIAAEKAPTDDPDYSKVTGSL
jgi:preprotein translocase subunit SecA